MEADTVFLYLFTYWVFLLQRNERFAHSLCAMRLVDRLIRISCVKSFLQIFDKKIISHKHSHIHIHERRSSSFSSERFFGFNGNLLVSVYKRWTSRTKMWFSLLLVSSSFKQRLLFTCYFLQLIHSVLVGSLNSPQRKIACGSWSLLHISIFCMHKKTENVK